MASTDNPGGGSSGKSGPQRTNLGSASGAKERSPTMNTHKGSRVEPSHTNQKQRGIAGGQRQSSKRPKM